MNATKNITAKLFTLLILLTITVGNSLAQEGVIWTRIPSASELGIEKNNGKLISASATVNELINKHSITAIFPALPASKNKVLQEVYQIECGCNEHELLQDISRLHTLFVGPELGPHYETLFTPNDFSTVFPYDYSLELIKAKEAWDITKGDSSILISITDAGFDMNNIEFQGKIKFVSNGITTSNIAHGTAVALTASGATDNNFGKSAIGYNSSLELRGMSYNELLASTYSGADVVNASWAAGCYFMTYGQLVIDEIYANGTVIVAAAGNGSTCNDASTMVYPASYNHVISVTSVGPSNNHERTIGNPATTHQHNIMVDIAAPGYDLPVPINNNGFTTANGTSFASPLVSGTIALMLAVNPCLSSDDIEYILKQTADTIINTLNPQYVGRIGAGRLDAFKAVQMAKHFSTFQVQTEVEVLCQFNSQIISITEFQGAAPYSINWSHGEPGLVCVTGPADTYTLDVIDSLGCRFHKEFEIENIVPISIHANIENVSCFGTANGSIDLMISGGYPDYAVEWSNGATSSTIENLAPGIYEVQISDLKGCTHSEILEITEPLLLAVELELTHPNEYVRGSIDVTAFGGSGVLSYNWHTGATTEDLANLSEGIYQLTVTDENGCSETKLAILQQMSVAGVSDEATASTQLYPNPASTYFHLVNEKEMIETVHVYNMTGQLVITKEVNTHEVTIETQQLENGTYWVHATLANGLLVKSQVVVQN